MGSASGITEHILKEEILPELCLVEKQTPERWGRMYRREEKKKEWEDKAGTWGESLPVGTVRWTNKKHDGKGMSKSVFACLWFNPPFPGFHQNLTCLYLYVSEWLGHKEKTSMDSEVYPRVTFSDLCVGLRVSRGNDKWFEVSGGREEWKIHGGPEKYLSYTMLQEGGLRRREAVERITDFFLMLW